MQEFFKKNFSKENDLAACLVPHDAMQHGNKCPEFLKDLVKTLAKSP